LIIKYIPSIHSSPFYTGLGQEPGEVDLHVLDGVHPQVLPHPEGQLLNGQVDYHHGGLPDAGAEHHHQTDHPHDHI